MVSDRDVVDFHNLSGLGYHNLFGLGYHNLIEWGYHNLLNGEDLMPSRV